MLIVWFCVNHESHSFISHSNFIQTPIPEKDNRFERKRKEKEKLEKEEKNNQGKEKGKKNNPFLWWISSNLLWILWGGLFLRLGLRPTINERFETAGICHGY